MSADTLDLDRGAMSAMMLRVYPELAAAMARIKARDHLDECAQIRLALRDWFKKRDMQRARREISRRRCL